MPWQLDFLAHFIIINIMRRLLVLLLIFTGAVSGGILDTGAVSLSGGVSENIINKGFFGTWHVTSKLIESNSSTEFQALSVHIWNLSGYGNVLILENQFSGARSEIKVDKAVNGPNGGMDGALLKFRRVQEKGDGANKIVLTETPEITLEGDVFKGYDTFFIEKYKDGVLYKKEVVKYKIVGQRIVGNSIGAP